MKMKTRVLPLLAMLGLGACGDDAPTAPTVRATPPPVNVPNVAGVYSASNMWLVQFVRVSDSFRSSYTCTGTLTLSQGTPVAGVASLTGFGVVSTPCAPVSFGLSGTVDANGAISLAGDGPRPPECEAPRATYEGLVTGRTLSARSKETLTVLCSGAVSGTHRLDYIITGSRTS